MAPAAWSSARTGSGPLRRYATGSTTTADGVVDEPGAAPDGIDGTTDPLNPSQKIGDTCGNNQGQCQPGTLKCIAGLVLCGGGTSAQVETCNCLDDDCDGKTDEEPTAGSGDPKICAEGKVCVKYQGGCQCAAPCGSGEFKCPTGAYTCQEVNKSGTDPEESAGARCVAEPCSDCSSQTVTSNGAVECAPAGTTTDAGTTAPVCVCKGQDGCHNPCHGVTCTTPLVCTDYGTNAGKCVEDNCWNFPCNAGQACDNGTCVANPCKSTTLQGRRGLQAQRGLQHHRVCEDVRFRHLQGQREVRQRHLRGDRLHRRLPLRPGLRQRHLHHEQVHVNDLLERFLLQSCDRRLRQLPPARVCCARPARLARTANATRRNKTPGPRVARVATRAAAREVMPAPAARAVRAERRVLVELKLLHREVRGG